MSTARVFRRLPGYHDERVVMLFRAYEFADSLSLSVNFGDNEEMLTVRNMSGDSVPLWFTNGRSNDITVRASTATALAADISTHSNPFFGVVIERQFERPGTYDVRFVVAGTLPDAEAPQRALIVARVDVRQKSLENQLAGGPLIYAQSPVNSGTTTELLVIVRRLIRGVAFSIYFGDGMWQSLSTDVFSIRDLPGWLLDGTFSSPEPFSIASRGVTYYGSVVTHMFREPGFYASVAKVTVVLGDHCEVFTSPATIIHVMDRSTPPMSQLLGDDALVVSTPLHAEKGFLAFYLAARNIAGARYTFSFGDGTGQKEGITCSEWPHIDDSDSTIAGRLPLDEARMGAATAAVCTSHEYAKPGTYTVRVRLVATPSGISQRSWNLGGRVTVLPRLPDVLTTSVSTKQFVISHFPALLSL